MKALKEGSWSILKVKDEEPDLIVKTLESELALGVSTIWVLDFTFVESVEPTIFEKLTKLIAQFPIRVNQFQILNPGESVLRVLKETGFENKCQIRHLYPTAW
ncbi:MAG: hypothetical protein JNL74_04485 [Fibrobacteres bacterium]|nr:hypothetical protein [Fibrobacterota bacterium]